MVFFFGAGWGGHNFSKIRLGYGRGHGIMSFFSTFDYLPLGLIWSLSKCIWRWDFFFAFSFEFGFCERVGDALVKPLKGITYIRSLMNSRDLIYDALSE
jgi:hypothetical protein